jgi:hypothetical protein
MGLLDLLTRKGRARAGMSWATRWRREGKDFRRERRGIKKIRRLRYEEHHTERLIKEGIEFFDADETAQSAKQRIEEFIREHELIRTMIRVANIEEYRLLERVEKMQERLLSFQARHQDLKELGEMIRELHAAMENIRSILNTERMRARDVVRDHQKMRDRTFLPFAMIYFKIRRKAKEGKKDAKHLKKLARNVEHVLTTLDKKATPGEVEKAITKLHKDLKRGEQEMIEEVRDLAQIEQYLTVLEFRHGIDKMDALIDKLKEIQFPPYKLEELEEQLREAHSIVEKMHDKEKTETRALYQKAIRAT